MNQTELFSELREMIGNPDVNDVSNRQLRNYLANAANWLADQLKYSVVTDELGLLLVEDQQEYQLPDALAWMIWLEWNDIKLTPNTTFGWERDGDNWRSATSSLPSEFAMQGRKLILNPPPSSDAITTDTYLAMRYIATSPGLTPLGTPELSEMDQQSLLFRAAHQYCSRRTTDPAHVARAQSYEKELSIVLKRALARADNPIEDLTERFTVFTNSRLGGAR